MRKGLIVIICFMCTVSSVHAVEYELIDLGTLGENTSYAHSINNKGQIVGVSHISPSTSHAFLWEKGIIKDIGTISGNNSDHSQAYGINDNRMVVGGSRVDSNNWHAFLWSDGIISDIHTLPGNYSEASTINSNGWIIGEYTSPTGENSAFLYKDTEMMEIGTLGGDLTDVDDINNYGQIVGSSRTLNGDLRAFIWDNGVMTNLGNNTIAARGINDAGQIVGRTNTGSFLWENESIIDIPGMQAHSINDKGQVVGMMDGGHAAIWFEGTLNNLNDLVNQETNWELIYAYDINNKGQIVGFGNNPEGHGRAFLLNPVPEPCSLALFALAGLALRKRN